MSELILSLSMLRAFSVPISLFGFFFGGDLVNSFLVVFFFFGDLGARFGDFAPLGDLTGLGDFAALGRPFFTAPLSVKELHIRYQV